MKYRLGWIGLLAVLAAVLAFWITHRVTGRPAAADLDRLQDVAVLTKILELDDEQARTVAGLQAALHARLRECCDRHCRARMRLGKELAAPDPDADADAAERLLEEMIRAQAASERATFEHLRAVHAVLRPEQRLRLHRMLNDSLCQACPSCPARDDSHAHE